MTVPVSWTHQFARRVKSTPLSTVPSIVGVPLFAGVETEHVGLGAGGGGGGGAGGCTTGAGGSHLFMSVVLGWREARIAQCTASCPPPGLLRPWETPATNGVATRATSPMITRFTVSLRAQFGLRRGAACLSGPVKIALPDPASCAAHHVGT